MMLSRTGYIYCTCKAECSANGGIDADGKFKGVKMTTSEFKAHCHRIRREALKRAGEDLFVSTVSDGHISSLPRPASITHPPTLISLPSSAAGPASITQPLTSSDTTLPLSSPSLINPNLRTHTNRELSEDTMPLLISNDEDDKADKAISLASQRRERNKRTVTDKTILENIKRKIEECMVTASCPVLQETQNTIQTLQIKIKGIRSRVTSIAALKSDILKSLDNLEAHWTELSNLLADNLPVEYSTGTILQL